MLFLPFNFISEKAWVNIFSSLSTTVLTLEIYSLLMLSIFSLSFKILRTTTVSRICEQVNVCHSSGSQDSDIAQGRCWHCWCWVFISLEGSVLQITVMLDSTCLSALSHTIPGLYILSLCFHNFLLIILESLSPLWQILFHVNFNHRPEFQNRPWK